MAHCSPLQLGSARQAMQSCNHFVGADRGLQQADVIPSLSKFKQCDYFVRLKAY
jgi:hypothetical protein